MLRFRESNSIIPFLEIPSFGFWQKLTIRLCDLINTSLIMLFHRSLHFIHYDPWEYVTLAIGSFCSNRYTLCTHVHQSLRWFLSERAISKPRRTTRTFLSPVVNHFINLRRIMPRVKRRPEVNVSSAPSLISRHIPCYLFSPTSSSTLHKHCQVEENRYPILNQ